MNNRKKLTKVDFGLVLSIDILFFAINHVSKHLIVKSEYTHKFENNLF